MDGDLHPVPPLLEVLLAAPIPAMVVEMVVLVVLAVITEDIRVIVVKVVELADIVEQVELAVHNVLAVQGITEPVAVEAEAQTDGIKTLAARVQAVVAAELVYMAKEQVAPVVQELLATLRQARSLTVLAEQAAEDRVADRVAKEVSIIIQDLQGFMKPELLDLKQLHPTVVHTELQDNLDTPVQQSQQEVVAEVEP